MATTFNIYQNGQKIASTSATNFPLKNLSAATNYSIEISAVLDEKEGEKTPPLVLRTKFSDNAALHPPFNPSMTLENNALILSWDY